MVEQISPDDLITHLISLSQEDTERAFEKGEIISYLLVMGYTYDSIASQINCSAQQVRILHKTFNAFPHEDDRTFHEQSYYHYRVAATTDDPQSWMKKAQENEWSTREMMNAVKKKPTPDEYREAERLLFKVKTYINQDTKEANWFRGKLFELLSKEQLKHAI